jgi:Gram-negative bacterial TonB protein C-terminal
VDHRVIKSIPMLDEAALTAVRQWQFGPLCATGGHDDRVVILHKAQGRPNLAVELCNDRCVVARADLPLDDTALHACIKRC